MSLFLYRVDLQVIVKVGDFGLARKVEEDTGDYKVNYPTRPMPIKWMAPECLTNNKFSTFSDVVSAQALSGSVCRRMQQAIRRETPIFEELF